MIAETDKNIIIIEDEYSIAMDIEMRLQKMGYRVVGIANSYNDALPLLLEESVDIALLDINLGEEKSGIDLGKLIRSKFNIPIVFITAYTDSKTFSEALEANPMGFITKPFKDADLHNNIQLAFNKFSKEVESSPEFKTDNKYIFIKDKGVFQQVEIDSILWIEAMDNYTIVHTKNEKLVVHAFLKDVLLRLGSPFVRIHRSHAVAMNKITTIEDNVVYIGKTFLIISQNYRSDLLDRMNIL
jgi:DNA-binding LytR/AlgR family response regulator